MKQQPRRLWVFVWSVAVIDACAEERQPQPVMPSEQRSGATAAAGPAPASVPASVIDAGIADSGTTMGNDGAGQVAAAGGGGAGAAGGGALAGGAGEPGTTQAGAASTLDPQPGAADTTPDAGAQAQAQDEDELPSSDAFPKLEAGMFATPKLISQQFDLAEGPVWDHCTARLLFADVNTRTIHTFVPGGEVGIYVAGTNYVNGMIFDPEGRLIMAEMGGGNGGRITRMGRDMSVEVLIDHTPTGGRLQTTDDLAMRSDGTIYFSDPVISHGPYVAVSLASAPFYQLKPGAPGMREVVRAGQGRGTNGLLLTRDDKTLLVNEYSADKISKYTVAEDGSVEAAGDFATGLDKVDSMCMDVAGNVYAGMATGIQVLRPDGSKVTLLRVGSDTTNCGFGGPDGRTLFITAWSKLLEVEAMPVPGLDWYRNKSMQCP